MVAVKRTCPHCGAEFQERDTECLTCHKSLVLAAPLLHHTAPVEVSANLSPRSHARHPGAHQVVEAVGRPWEVFPWAVVGLWVLVAALYFVGDMPPLILLGAKWLLAFFQGVSVFWICVDVQAMDAGWWWIPLYVLVPPLGPLTYLLWGRD